jgi:hypothetical protein
MLDRDVIDENPPVRKTRKTRAEMDCLPAEAELHAKTNSLIEFLMLAARIGTTQNGWLSRVRGKLGTGSEFRALLGDA